MALTVKCYGVCGGEPGWRHPETGLPCSLCGSSGKVTVYHQMETYEKEWAEVYEKQRRKKDGNHRR
jgi:hypothetical protein